jgi:hypothetical protein
MNTIRKYSHGGSHPDDKLQRVVDTIAYTGERGEKKYDVNTLLDVLKFTNTPNEQKVMDDIFSATSPEERQKQFRAFKTKQGDIRVTSLDPVSSQYNPATTVRGMTDDQISNLAGRPLSNTETREFRGLLMSDPSFLDYFINIEEKKPRRGEFRKVNIAKNVGGKGVPGGGTTGEKGSTETNAIQNFLNRCSRAEGCDVKSLKETLGL